MRKVILRYRKFAKLLAAIVGGLLFAWILISQHHSPQSVASKSRNYFLDSKEYEKMGFIIDTQTCKIPDIDLLHSSVAPLIEKPHTYGCAKNRRWSYVVGQTLYLNTTKMEEEGYPLHMLLCCYKWIDRVPQDPDQYDGEVDSTVGFSATCVPMNEVNEPEDEYIVVVCKLRYLVNEFENIYLYKYFHAIAQPASSINTKRKVEYWKTKPQTAARPPNVIIVGMDSTSRLNFNRQMPQTHQIVKEMGAFEMLGYTKVGYNTFPNSVPYFSGYSEEELRQICMYTSETKQDLCPYIWKRFDEANYLTAHVEDSPLLMAFNNFKVGFVQQPTDYYLRTLMLAVYKNEGNYPLVIDCIGNQTVDEFLLLYMEQLLEMATSLNIPIFLSSWLTNVAHDSWNQIHEVDDVYSGFLRRLRAKNLLTNSILFLMGDHGYNYGPFRETFSGWYESKLPNMKIVVSEDLQEKHLHWRDNLLTNSRRLTSPFDLYWTFSDILDTFTTTRSPVDALNRSMVRFPRKYGQSFFKEISVDRTCEEAGVPDSYCACSLPVKLSLKENPELQQGAAFVINYINNNLISPTACKPLQLHQVLGGSTLTMTSQNYSSMAGYIITFQTQPGDFIFETDIYYSITNRTFELPANPNIQRLSKFNTPVNCVSNSVQQLYCYCK